MRNKNIYNENRKISAARQQFSLRGNISVTARSRTRAKGTLASESSISVTFSWCIVYWHSVLKSAHSNVQNIHTL
jgi:hypothetical protein